MPVHTVFSIDGSRFQRWQAELLAYSHRKVHQPGPLTRLYSARNKPSVFAGRTFRTPPYSPHPETKDDYAPYNRIGALAEWLETSPPKESTVLVLDPDFVFLTPYDEPVKRGRPVTQRVAYMRPEIPRNAKVLQRHGYKARSVQPMGIPLLIHQDDLRALLPLWMEKTMAIRDDRVSRKYANWISDMWGYVFAAIDLGLRHELRNLAGWIDQKGGLPFIHYCHNSVVGTWQWSKYKYKAWKAVPEPPDGAPGTTVALVSLLNELARKKQHKIV